MKCIGPTIAQEEIRRIRQIMATATELNRDAELFAVAASETRLKILYLLAELQELCVCDLAEMLGLSVSAVSQHLAKLRAHGLATTRRQAQTIFYRLEPHPFLAVLRQTSFHRFELQAELQVAAAG